MNLSIHETTVSYPEKSQRFIIEEQTQCGWKIVAITETETEAIELYDRLNGQEVDL